MSFVSQAPGGCGLAGVGWSCVDCGMLSAQLGTSSKQAYQLGSHLAHSHQLDTLCTHSG